MPIDPNFEFGKKYYSPESFPGPGSYFKNTAMTAGNKLKSLFGFKHGGPVKMKSGGNVPGMYKHGGMHDGMDSIKPVRGIYHKSFKNK